MTGASPAKLVRRFSGSHLVEGTDPELWIIRTEWQGPRGGTRILWEVAEYEPGAGLCIGSGLSRDFPPEYTLREAWANVKSKLEAGE